MILPGKGKTKFRLQLNNYKSKHRFFRKGKIMSHKSFFIHTYVQNCRKASNDWEVTLFEKSETYK